MLTADRRRVLTLLAGNPVGFIEPLLLAYGFTRDLLADLIVDGLASAATERAMAGFRLVDVRRIRITDAGRAAL